MREFATIVLLLAALWPCSGCRTFNPVDEDAITAGHPPFDSSPSSHKADPATSSTPDNSKEESTSTPAKGANKAPAADASANSPKADDQNLRQTVAELVAAGALDRAAEQQLTSDLAKTDPALRRQLAELLLTSLATRKGPACDERSSRSIADAEAEALEQSTEAAPETRAEPLVRAPRVRDRQAARHPEAEQTTLHDALVDLEKPSPATHDAPQSVAHDARLPESDTGAAQPVESAATKVAAETKSDRPAARDATLPGNWQANLDAAVEELASELGSNPETQEDVGRQAMLRMLYLVDGKRDMALRPIPGAPPAQQDFWSKQMFGLSSYLDADRNSNPGRRAAEAASHLRDATNKLGELATLSVRNIAFCSEVKSYGIYKKLDHYEFAASQDLLVYAEIENFKSVHTEQGYHTVLRASYEIVDTKGARVTEQEFPVTEEHCQNARRDFFVRYFVKLPAQIYGGKYTLHLYVVDENSQKMDQGSIEFTINTKGH